MIKQLAILLFTVGMINVPAAAVDLPTEYDPNSRYRLEYADLDTVLRGSVLEMGPSTHNRARSSRNNTGTKISLANPLPSRFEGNRVMFHLFKPEQVAFLADMRDDLLAVPEQVALEKLTRDEQLAYWFNLHNAIVLAEIARQYPVTNIEPLFDEANADAFYKQRLFKFNGTAISVQDIQEHVRTNWTDPLVIYGFYMGAVGTPNILNTAFTAAEVYDQLRENAVDFVNSVRGTEVWRRSELRVSTYYKRNAVLFTDFEKDVQAHIRRYAKSRLLSRMTSIDSMTVTLENWYIADLYNGNLGQVAGSYPITSLDNIGRIVSPDLPEHVVELIRYRREKNKRYRRRQDVGVEELEDPDNE